MKPLRFLAVALFPLAVSAANLLPNPGFESTAGGAPSEWTCPDYWSGVCVSDAAAVHNGQRAARLEPAEKAGRKWARIHSRVVPVVPGLRYRLSVWAKGSGILKLGLIHYLPNTYRPPYQTAWTEAPLALGEEWQEAVYEAVAANHDVLSMAAMIEVEGDGPAWVDDAAFDAVRRVDGTLEAAAPYQMVAVGAGAEVTVTATAAGPLAPDAKLIRLVRGEATEAGELPLNGGGPVTVALSPAQTATPGLRRVDVVQPDLGAVATAYVDVVQAAEYERFAAAAARVRRPTGPVHLLFLGDSLTDFDRGRNYTDQVVHWLGRALEETVTARNAGVGGDYITRVWDRLNGDPKVHRPTMYDHLFEPRPQRVFVFLGHNDSKLSSASGFTEPAVKPEDFDRLLRATIQKIRAETGAAVTVMSNTSSVYEICLERAEKLVADGKPASLFGKPEVMEQFNAIAQRVAAELGCDWLDVYAPTRAHPDKPSLFLPDGVHLSPAGHHLIARLVLEHLATVGWTAQ